ncbi:MAG: LysM peptidoglycan-binding domain-containing protein [Anaerolineae bacterium]
MSCTLIVALLLTAAPASAAPAAAARPSGVALPLAPQQPLADPTPTWTTSQVLQDLMTQLDTAWNAQDWVVALSLINQIIAIDPNYSDIQERRYFAHVNYGYQLLTAGRCTDAVATFRQALALQADGEEALMGLDLVSRYCPTPVPGVTVTATVTVTVTPKTPTVTPTPVALTGPITYTVQPGDTLYSLAKRYGTTVQAIMQANGMMTYFLRSGSLIWIPAGGTPTAGPLVHIVQPGETLYAIAKRYNTTVMAIMSANGLSSTYIWAYRALYIPSVSQQGAIIHIVMPGETLYTIAQRHGATVPLIMLANNLSSYSIYVYQKLVIPPEGWSGWPVGSPGYWTGEGSPSSGTLYTVRRGDTLFSIARRYGTTVAALVSANGLTNTDIRAGMTLRIP